MPAWLAPAIGAVGGIAGSLIKGKQDRDFTREQFEAQNTEFNRRFDMTNEYNSPRNQAARLEQANLNKALLYGQGAAGASGNTQLQGQSNAQAVNHVDPLSTGLSYLSAFQDLQVKQAQADNIAANTTKTLNDAVTSRIESEWRDRMLSDKAELNVGQIAKQDEELKVLSQKLGLDIKLQRQNLAKQYQDTRVSKFKADIYDKLGLAADPLMRGLIMSGVGGAAAIGSRKLSKSRYLKKGKKELSEWFKKRKN